MKLISLIFVFLLVSCSSGGPTKVDNSDYGTAATAPMPSVRVESKPVKESDISGSDSRSLNRIAVRKLLYRSQALKNTDYNIIAFAHKPQSDKEKEKLITICELWKNLVIDESQYQDIIANGGDSYYLVPFYWPLKQRVENDDCSTLVDNYDYNRTNLLYQTLRIESKDVQLLYRVKTAVVTMDLSKLESKSDLSTAMYVWAGKMCTFFDKSTSLKPLTLSESLIKVLGALGNFVQFKVKT